MIPCFALPTRYLPCLPIQPCPRRQDYVSILSTVNSAIIFYELSLEVKQIKSESYNKQEGYLYLNNQSINNTTAPLLLRINQHITPST